MGQEKKAGLICIYLRGEKFSVSSYTNMYFVHLYNTEYLDFALILFNILLTCSICIFFLKYIRIGGASGCAKVPAGRDGNESLR